MKTLDQVKPIANDLSEPSHTPGPWMSAIDNPNCILAPAATGLCIVATLPREGTQKRQTKANSALIAAAPELLAALETVAALLPEWTKPTHNTIDGKILATCLPAIAKAKGEIYTPVF